jgi:sn-glycerol 3-phosphate transport system substrate-binding protein
MHCPVHPLTFASRPLRSLVAVAVVATGVPGIALAGAALDSAPAQAASLPSCPLSALQKAKGTVNITFWNSAAQNNQTTLVTLTNQFNASQHKIHVTLAQQPSYDDTWTKYVSGLSNGELPNVVQMEDIYTAPTVDSQSTLPVQSCINASHYSTSDYLTRALNYWKINGVEQAMPWAVSTPVLYYNKQAFSKAGLNPDDPPTTFAEMASDAQKLKASGDSGMGLKIWPWLLETWLATANQLVVNNSNGRSGTASKAVYDNQVGQQLFTQLNDIVKSGAAQTNFYVGPTAEDDLLGIGNGKYGMAIDTSAALGTILALLKGGQYPNVTLGVAPFPALSSQDKGGVAPGGSSFFIVKKGATPAQQAASWAYITFMDSTASMATWSVGTGYIPIRKSSVQTSTIQQAWQADPEYQVAYKSLLDGPTTSATSGAVIGAYGAVYTAESNAWQSMYQSGVSPKSAVKSSVSNSTTAMQQYNQRLGS